MLISAPRGLYVGGGGGRRRQFLVGDCNVWRHDKFYITHFNNVEEDIKCLILGIALCRAVIEVLKGCVGLSIWSYDTTSDWVPCLVSMSVHLWRCYVEDPWADHRSTAARLVFLVGGGGAPTSCDRRRQRRFKVGGGGVKYIFIAYNFNHVEEPVKI